MYFNFLKNKTEMCFTWKERFVLLFRGKIIYEKKQSKQLANHFAQMAMQIVDVVKDDEEIKNLMSVSGENIETK